MVGIFILSTALIVFYSGYLSLMAVHFARLLRMPAPNPGPEKPMVSVIVPARNEAGNVAACLRSLLAQRYPADRYEVILVNDHSEDATVAVAMEAAGTAPHFRLLHSDRRSGVAYKKAAVATGIQAARGELILTTDADCTAGPDWVGTMAAHFLPGVAMVSGPVVLEGKTLFERFQALEFMGLVAVGAASIHAGNPTMCNGANLAYRRSAFDAVGGFAGIDHIASGDDELLMHKIAAQAGMEIRFAGSREAVVRTAALPTWAAFKAQRIRWVSKSTQYKRTAITVTLVLAWLAMASFPLLAVLGFWDARAWAFLGVNLLLKAGAEAAVLCQAAAFFGNLRLLLLLPVEQVAHIAYVLWVGIAGNRKAYIWKGREVR